MLIKRFFLFLLLVSFVSIGAESKIYFLSPDFNGVDAVEFVSINGQDGKVIKGNLINKIGVRFSLPDTCEPEGGEAELSDVYTVSGNRNYLLFTCAWPVMHAGIGLSGTQYETFVYVEKKSVPIDNEIGFSRVLSGYEGGLEGGGSSYAWYVSRKIAREKVLELEGGRSDDSLTLAHNIVLNRLADGDVEAIKSYLNARRLQQLLLEYPVNMSTVIIYNDFGYALGQTGENVRAYEVLKEVEKKYPERVVLKLNIADVLWESNKYESKAYYREYISLMRKAGKERLIPVGVFDKLNFK